MKKQPLYQIIYEELLEGIRNKDYPVGSYLPTEKSLSEQYQVSRITSKKALELLAKQGIILRRPGKGSIVTDAELPPPGQPIPVPVSVNQNNKLIGVVMEGFGASFGHEMLLGIEKGCQEYGYSFILKCSYGSKDRETEAINELLSLGVSGILIMCVHGENYNAKVLELVYRGFPIIAIDRRLKGIPVSFVGTDNRQATWDLTKYLLDKGYRNICFVSSNSAAVSSLQERENGFIDCCTEHGVLIYRLITDMISTLPISRGEKSLEHDIASITEFIQTHEKVDAFIAAEYDMARIIQRALRNLGIQDKYPIVCFDGIPNVLEEHDFTHVMQQEQLIGKEAVRLLKNAAEELSGTEVVIVPHRIAEITK